jgi:hypothetical protein
MHCGVKRLWSEIGDMQIFMPASPFIEDKKGSRGSELKSPFFEEDEMKSFDEILDSFKESPDSQAQFKSPLPLTK